MKRKESHWMKQAGFIANSKISKSSNAANASSHVLALRAHKNNSNKKLALVLKSQKYSVKCIRANGLFLSTNFQSNWFFFLNSMRTDLCTSFIRKQYSFIMFISIIWISKDITQMPFFQLSEKVSNPGV